MRSKPRVLVVDDEPDMCWFLSGILEAQGLEVVTARDGAVALESVRQEAPSAILLDLKMPNLGGMEALVEFKTTHPRVPIIILTAYADISTAVQAMRLGAYDYITKPFQNDEIILTVRRALEQQALLAEVETLRSQLGKSGSLGELMGPSQHVQTIIQQVHLVARSPLTILLHGETGTGKELVAWAIHQQSDRHEQPFIAVDCGAIPETLIESELFGHEKGAFTGADRKKEGHFQLAEGGSLFLDEITNLPLSIQSKLLRVLQERQVRLLGGKRAYPVDVRIITASNVPLEQEIRAGRFRQDLYYRLNEFSIHLPPLRERREDIPYLAKRFLEEAGMEFKRPVRGISDEAAQLLLRYPWPGNVRELRNVIRRVILMSAGLIRPEHLLALDTKDSVVVASAPEPCPGLASLSLKEASNKAAAEAERHAIRQALAASRGNKSEAARLLRTDYKTLHLKMKRYGISTHEFLSS